MSDYNENEQKGTKSSENIERANLRRELIRLFTLQDRPLTDEKASVLVNELILTKIPNGAIVAGIRNLCDDDLKSIKFTTIKQAANKFVTHVYDNYHCDHCKGEGVIMMICTGYEYDYNTSLACTCDRGQLIGNANGILKWNGEDYQEAKNRKFTYKPYPSSFKRKTNYPELMNKSEEIKSLVKL